MTIIEELTYKNDELTEQNKKLRFKLEFIERKDAELAQTLVEVLSILNATGFIHGASSKERAKELLLEAMADRGFASKIENWFITWGEIKMGEQLILCNKCGQFKEASNYYQYFDSKRNTFKLTFGKICKRCYIERQQQMVVKINNNKEDFNPKDPDSWICRNLKEFGNCFIQKERNIEALKQKTGLDLIMRSAVDGGYVLEVVK